MDASVEDLVADLAVARSRVGKADLTSALAIAEARIREWHSTATRILRPPREGLTEVPTNAAIAEKASVASAALDDAVETAAAYGFEFRSLAEATMAAATARMIALARRCRSYRE
jgi:methyl-accepting chemotaxis protein